MVVLMDEVAEQVRRRMLALASPADLASVCDPSYVQRDHLVLISDEIASAAPGDRLAISTPPQVGKSVTAVQWAAFWRLVRNPGARLVIASYAQWLASASGRRVRDLVAEHGPALGVFLSPTRQAAEDWETTAGGGVRSVGISTGLTGKPADALFIDDPHKDRAEADSRVYRERVWEWWTSVALSRLAPGAPVVLVMTRWHPEDLWGKVLAHEPQRWRQLVMPAIARAADDPLRRAVGAPLPHPRLDPANAAALLEHWRAVQRSAGVRTWGSLYQAEPTPGGTALLAEGLVVERRCLPPLCTPVPASRVAVAVDPSGGGRDLAGIIGGHLGTDGRLAFTHDRSLNGSSEQWSRAACLLAYEMGADSIVAERNYGGDMVRLTLRTAWAALEAEGQVDGLPPAVTTVHARRGKALRAEPVAQQWMENRCYTGAYLPDLESEWCTWHPEAGYSPGRLDASVYLAYHLLPTPGASNAVIQSAGAVRLR